MLVFAFAAAIAAFLVVFVWVMVGYRRSCKEWRRLSMIAAECQREAYEAERQDFEPFHVSGVIAMRGRREGGSKLVHNPARH